MNCSKTVVFLVGILLAVIAVRNVNEGEHAVRQTISDKSGCTLKSHGVPLAVLLTALLGIGGCGGGGGGGGGGDATSGTASTSTSTPDDNGGTGGTTISTLLDENPVSGIASFDNFTATGLQLSVAQILASEGVTFAGDQTFLKLARSSGEILFLGEVNRDQRLELLINLPLGTRSLRYEIFSGSPLDDTLFGEIAL